MVTCRLFKNALGVGHGLKQGRERQLHGVAVQRRHDGQAGSIGSGANGSILQKEEGWEREGKLTARGSWPARQPPPRRPAGLLQAARRTAKPVCTADIPGTAPEQKRNRAARAAS